MKRYVVVRTMRDEPDVKTVMTKPGARSACEKYTRTMNALACEYGKYTYSTAAASQERGTAIKSN